MKNIAEQILEGLSKFYVGFQNRRVLKTMEEIEANTDEQNIPSALLLGEINNKLMFSLPDDIKLIVEGSGADVKYYAQLGADAASKKRLGRNKIIIPSMSCGIGGNATASSGYRLDVSEYKKMSIGSYTAAGTWAYVDINGLGANNEKIFRDTFGSSFNAKVYDITHCKSVFFNFNCQAGTATLQNVEIS